MMSRSTWGFTAPRSARLRFHRHANASTHVSEEHLKRLSLAGTNQGIFQCLIFILFEQCRGNGDKIVFKNRTGQDAPNGMPPFSLASLALQGQGSQRQ